MDALRNRRIQFPALALPLIGGLLLAGCSMVVMTQRMLFGDPLIPCAFKNITGVDLANSQKKVVVICTVPAAVENQYPSISSDILESVTLRLKREGVRVVSADKVHDWFEENNGTFAGMDSLAEAFDADYAIHIELVEFTHRADNSPNMLQGNTRGYVRAYRLAKKGRRRVAREIYTDEDFRSTFPEHNPIPGNQRSSNQFLLEYTKRISTLLAQKFHDYHVSDTVH